MSERLIFSEMDRCRLGPLLLTNEARAAEPGRLLDELEWELESEEVVHPELVPENVVTMGSTVLLVEEVSAQEITRTIVYPEDVDLFDDSISILTPLGAVLLGRQVGDVVECEDHHAGTSWRIAEILFQPERTGAFYL